MVSSDKETASADLQGALAQMAYLNDAALRQAARASMTVEQRTRLVTLHDKQQRERLTPEEQGEEQALLKLYQKMLIARAQAAVLLKQRNRPRTRYGCCIEYESS